MHATPALALWTSVTAVMLLVFEGLDLDLMTLVGLGHFCYFAG